MKSKRRAEICEQICVKRCKLSELASARVELEEELKMLKSRYNDLNGINALPFEVLCLIIERVPLQDLLSCEQVCAKWQEIVGQTKIEEAVIAKFGETPGRWSHSGRPVLAGSIILKSELNFSHFKNTFLPAALKRLKIRNASDDPFSNRTPHVPLIVNLEFVNRLVGLEVLEIAKLNFGKSVTLSLPKLRYLAIKELGSEVKLDCPNLTELKIASDSHWYPVFVFKNKITRLHLATVYRNHQMFPNLQYVCWKASSFFCTTSDLPHVPSLQMLSVRPKVGTYYYRYSKENFLRFLSQKNKWGSIEAQQLKLVFYGVLLENAAQLDGLDDAGDRFRDLTKLQLRNYDHLVDDELRWIKTMNYSSVMRAVDEATISSVPADLHQRFGRVREVWVDAQVADEQHLLHFLGKFGRLEKLSVNKAGLDRAFYERMAVQLPRLRKLFIHEANKHFGPDLDFVFKFPNLIELKTKALTIRQEFVRQLFDTYPTFALTFGKTTRYHDDYKTFRRPHPKMRIEYHSHESRDFYDVNELIEYYFNDEESEPESGESDSD